WINRSRGRSTGFSRRRPSADMFIGITVIELLAFVISITLTAVMRAFAVSHGVLDIPNARSSHAIPTPRGGGVAIVIGSVSAFSALFALGVVSSNLFAAVTGGGIAVAVVGLIDDRHPLPARTRLIV